MVDEVYILKNLCGTDGVNQYRTYSASWQLCRQVNMTPGQAIELAERDNLTHVSPMEVYRNTNGEM